MNKKIKYIYTDLDGTLLSDDKTVPENTLKYFDELRKQGIKIGMATGRSNYFAKKFADIIKPDLPLICSNGGKIYKHFNDFEHNLILDAQLDEDFANKLKDYCLADKIPFISFWNDGYYINDPTGKSKQINSLYVNVQKADDGFTKEFIQVNKDTRIKYSFKFLVLGNEMTKEQMDNLFVYLNKNGEYTDFYFSGLGGLDVMPKNVSKGNALKIVADLGIINPEETIVFGDEDNDISMFKFIPNSVSMKDGTEGAKKYAKYIAKKCNNEEAVMNFLKEYLTNE